MQNQTTDHTDAEADTEPTHPINTHRMYTRSKDEIFKPKQREQSRRRSMTKSLS